MKKALLFFPVAALLCVFAFSGMSIASTYDADKFYIEDVYNAAAKIDLSISNITTGDGVLEFMLTGSGDPTYDGVWSTFAGSSDGIDLKGLNNGFYLDLRLTWNGKVLEFGQNAMVTEFIEDETGLYTSIRWDTNGDKKFTSKDKDSTLIMTTSVVPVPPSLLLFASALIGLARFKRLGAVQI